MPLRNSLNVTGSLSSNVVSANTSVTSNVVYANTLNITGLSLSNTITANTSVTSNVVYANTFCYANGTSIISAPFTTGKAIAMSIVFGG